MATVATVATGIIIVRYNRYFWCCHKCCHIRKGDETILERTRFLELAARHANGEDVRVMRGGTAYHPLWYILKPAKGGGWLHTAHLKDAQAANSYLDAALGELEEVRE